MSDDLLDFGTVDVFYIYWERLGTTYYLKDMTPDVDHIEWTKSKRSAFYLYTDTEAQKLVKRISKTREGVGFESDERNIVDDLDVDDLP